MQLSRGVRDQGWMGIGRGTDGQTDRGPRRRRGRNEQARDGMRCDGSWGTSGKGYWRPGREGKRDTEKETENESERERIPAQ